MAEAAADAEPGEGRGERRGRGGLVRDERSGGLRPQTVDMLDAMGRQLGLDIRIGSDEELGGANGRYNATERSIVINGERLQGEPGEVAQRVLHTVLGHEVTHGLREAAREAPELWAAYRETVREAMGAEEFDRLVDETLERYRVAFERMRREYPERYGRLRDLSREDAEEEVMAEAGGRMLAEDEAGARRLIDRVAASGERPTAVVRRVLDWINQALARLRAMWRGTDLEQAQARRLEAMRKTWEGLYEYAAAKEREVAEAQVAAERAGDPAAEPPGTVGSARGEKFSIMGERGAAELDRADEAAGRKPRETRMAALERAKEIERAWGETEGSDEHRRMMEAAERVRGLKAVIVEKVPSGKEDAQTIYKAIGKVKNAETGTEVEFYNSAFKKNHKEGGEFEKSIPALKKAFEDSVLAYSEDDRLGGTVRKDGTVHKAHPDIESYDNYVGKVSIEGKEYYVRYTVTRQKGDHGGTHSMFVTDVKLYENAAAGKNDTEFPSGRTSGNDVVDAKLQRFFALASGNAHDFATVAAGPAAAAAAR